jgi:hypothetical protein
VQKFAGTAFILVLSAQTLQAAGLCKQWVRRQNLPGVSSKVLAESSGISSSVKFPDERYYHINDSGSGSAFHVSYVTEGRRELESSRVDGYEADDLESIDVGPCPVRSAGSCLFLADVGNNDLDRKNLKILVVGENKDYQKTTAARLVIHVEYERDPKGREQHNVEAMMIDPLSGDIYTVTKRSSPKNGVAEDLDPRVYVIRRVDYENAEGEVSLKFTYLRTLKLSQIFPLSVKDEGDKKKMSKYLVTDADFSPDGERFVLLFKGDMIEFDSKVLTNTAALKATDFSAALRGVAPVLEQQEAVTYTSDGESIVYTSEQKDRGSVPETELLQLRCVER